MGHRLLEHYSSLMQLCSFDFAAAKEKLEKICLEYFQPAELRAQIDQMCQTYLSLSDADICISKTAGGKFCEISKARFISLPSGFTDALGREIRIYMSRTIEEMHRGGQFRCTGFGILMLPATENDSGIQKQIQNSHNQSINKAVVRKRVSSLAQQIHRQHNFVHELQTQAQLLKYELENYSREALARPDAPRESLTARFLKRIRAILKK